jgi:hypothetical protein
MPPALEVVANICCLVPVAVESQGLLSTAVIDCETGAPTLV